MKITDLLSSNAIQLKGVAHNKEEVINNMVKLTINSKGILKVTTIT